MSQPPRKRRAHWNQPWSRQTTEVDIADEAEEQNTEEIMVDEPAALDPTK